MTTKRSRGDVYRLCCWRRRQFVYREVVAAGDFGGGPTPQNCHPPRQRRCHRHSRNSRRSILSTKHFYQLRPCLPSPLRNLPTPISKTNYSRIGSWSLRGCGSGACVSSRTSSTPCLSHGSQKSRFLAPHVRWRRSPPPPLRCGYCSDRCLQPVHHLSSPLSCGHTRSRQRQVHPHTQQGCGCAVDYYGRR